jgi:hypothetical protein
MAKALADATVRIARAAAASEGMSPWTATDARAQALGTRLSAESVLRYIETQVGGGSGSRQWRLAAGLASSTVAMAGETEAIIEEAVRNGWS